MRRRGCSLKGAPAGGRCGCPEEALWRVLEIFGQRLWRSPLSACGGLENLRAFARIFLQTHQKYPCSMAALAVGTRSGVLGGVTMSDGM